MEFVLIIGLTLLNGLFAMSEMALASSRKPRLAAFEYMIDQLGATPDDFLHVSSSFRYDLMSATDIGIKNKVFVARGHESPHPGFAHTAVKDIGELASLLGL